MARSRLRVRTVVLVVTAVLVTAPAAALAVVGVLDEPVIEVPLPVETDAVLEDPAVPDVDPPVDADEVTGLIDDATTDDGLPSADGDPAASDGDGDGGSEDRSTGGGSERSSAPASPPVQRDEVRLTPAGVRAPSSAETDAGGILNLARPLAPAVVIAVIGLLLLAAAARGNDRLVKREPEGSRAGSWRL